ncbi:hypothetical protein K1719_021039 [Acacia pycnantha]|nr:hypothetical protein K1719_021039 [Acacia pycnantha]
MHIRHGSSRASACKNTFCICVSKFRGNSLFSTRQRHNFCLPNILLDKAMIPEAVFQSCSPEPSLIAQEVNA